MWQANPTQFRKFPLATYERLLDLAVDTRIGEPPSRVFPKLFRGQLVTAGILDEGYLGTVTTYGLDFLRSFLGYHEAWESGLHISERIPGKGRLTGDTLHRGKFFRKPAFTDGKVLLVGEIETPRGMKEATLTGKQMEGAVPGGKDRKLRQVKPVAFSRMVSEWVRIERIWMDNGISYSDWLFDFVLARVPGATFFERVKAGELDAREVHDAKDRIVGLIMPLRNDHGCPAGVVKIIEEAKV